MRALIAAFLLVMSVDVYAGSGYSVIEKMPLGGEGGWDYLTVDGSRNRLFVSRGTHVMVVDVASKKVIADIPNTPGVHGIALADELGRGFISNGRANTASLFDLETLKTIGQVRTGENPDAILYDPAAKRVFTFNGKSRDATVFDAASGMVLGTIALGGKPEFAVTDASGRVFVNIEDTSEVVALDSRKLKILRRYPLSPCAEPTGMAIDTGHHRVFSGCRNRLMTVLDVDAGKVTATVPIGEGVDGTAFDPETGLVFSSNSDGTLTVARESSPGMFETETIPTQRGARTLALDGRTHKVYLPTAEFSVAPESSGRAPKQRPTMIRDSFVVLVVGR